MPKKYKEKSYCRFTRIFCESANGDLEFGDEGQTANDPAPFVSYSSDLSSFPKSV